MNQQTASESRSKTKERPILFSAPMVRAILEGRKTQTRRIIKPQPPAHAIEVFDWRAPHIAESAKADEGCYYNDMDGLHFLCECPHGKPGDRIWVRESFSTDIRDPLNCVIYKATPEYGKYRDTGEVVRSTFPDGTFPTREESERAMLPKFWKGKPSIHMPRWASRITLEITGVRIERLNDISHEDAICEGIEPVNPKGWKDYRGTAQKYMSPVSSFQSLWFSINGLESWQSNPWVWVIEFRKNDCGEAGTLCNAS